MSSKSLRQTTSSAVVAEARKVHEWLAAADRVIVSERSEGAYHPPSTGARLVHGTYRPRDAQAFVANEGKSQRQNPRLRAGGETAIVLREEEHREIMPAYSGIAATISLPLGSRGMRWIRRPAVKRARTPGGRTGPRCFGRHCPCLDAAGVPMTPRSGCGMGLVGPSGCGCRPPTS